MHDYDPATMICKGCGAAYEFIREVPWLACPGNGSDMARFVAAFNAGAKSRDAEVLDLKLRLADIGERVQRIQAKMADF